MGGGGGGARSSQCSPQKVGKTLIFMFFGIVVMYVVTLNTVFTIITLLW